MDGGPAPAFAERHDGARVAYEVTGHPDGYPVFLMHGTPGCRIGPKPRGISLYRRGIKLISYDRPGYGWSDRWKGRGVADAAQDVAAVAERLHIDEFAIIGRSGGGPHALACAALMPDRVRRVAVLVSFAPADDPQLDWYEGMNDDNRRGFGREAPDSAAVEAEIRERARQTIADPHYLINHLRRQMPPRDRQTINQVGLRLKIVESHREALRNGSDGWVDDALALRTPWNFEPAKIDTARTDVLIWHGANDTFTPVSHAHLLAGQIRGARIHVSADAAHFDAIEALPAVLPWLAGGPLAADSTLLTTRR
ncbi:alpha/beta fold hydrolase [Dactylosporangium sp. NPDC051541]|uniref:alpha/beta fold hydrolase n=1 Tax=Dactylosporangium sp. NPDC051541 TaxID=3363977 RepID=UPI00379BCAEE